jgi:voltage-gated potassium channel Kch
LRDKTGAPVAVTEPNVPELPTTGLAGHAILIGHGRVGRLVAEVLLKNGQPLLVVEERKEVADQLRAKGVEVAKIRTALLEGPLNAGRKTPQFDVINTGERAQR